MIVMVMQQCQMTTTTDGRRALVSVYWRCGCRIECVGRSIVELVYSVQRTALPNKYAVLQLCDGRTQSDEALRLLSVNQIVVGPSSKLWFMFHFPHSLTVSYPAKVEAECEYASSCKVKAKCMGRMGAEWYGVNRTLRVERVWEE